MERKHRHVLNVSRSLLFESGLPLNILEDAIVTTMFLINRIRTYVLNGLSHFEKIYTYSPKFENLRVLGYLCFETRLNLLDKFPVRFEKCVLIGYFNEKKGYKLQSLDTSLTLFSRDVKFYDNVFPFKIKSYQVSSNDFSLNGQNDFVASESLRYLNY